MNECQKYAKKQWQKSKWPYLYKNLENTSSEQLPGIVMGVDINVKGACEKL